MSTMRMIPVNTPLLDGNERKYVLECLDTGWISSEGPFVAAFEEKLSSRLGRRWGVAVANGSVALDAAILAIGVQPGDEVILPTFTIISCAAAIVRAGAIPVLVDCDPRTWNMDVTAVESKITARTKAIMVVHIYGLPTDMAPIVGLAAKYRLKIIEDAAEAHGLTYFDKPCGSFGDASTFSFYPNKHVTTGEGGMILCDDDAIAERCRSLRNLCFQPTKRFVHEELGWNYRMTNLQAALGVAQLETLDRHLIRKREIGALYQQLLKNCPAIQLPVDACAGATNLYWVFGVVLSNAVRFNAAEVMRHLAAVGVGTRPFFWPMHEQPVFQRMGFFKGETYPIAERIARRGFYLPSGLGLSDADIHEVAERVTDILK